MSGTTEDAAIRPFTIEIPEAELEALRARIAATRWPGRETVADESQGVQLATMRTRTRQPGWLHQQPGIEAPPTHRVPIRSVVWPGARALANALS